MADTAIYVQSSGTVYSGTWLAKSTDFTVDSDAFGTMTIFISHTVASTSEVINTNSFTVNVVCGSSSNAVTSRVNKLSWLRDDTYPWIKHSLKKISLAKLEWMTLL